MTASPCRRGIGLICLAFGLLSQVPALAEESHPGLGLESEYSEAVIAFNKKQTEEALRILNDILKQKPDHVQALELKALTLKSGGSDSDALDTYQRLIRLKPEKERAPYYFEAAVIYNRQKKSSEARDSFEKALALDFNVEACHLFLGILEFGSGNPKDAEPHFEAVVKRSTPEIQTVGHYYLGLIHFKENYPAGGTSELLEARDLARDVLKSSPDSQIAKDIQAGAEKVLEPFREGQWFGNVTLLAQYDSNVSEVPAISNVPNSVSNSSTPKATLSAGIGHMSSPLSTIQWVPSYRLNYNYDFNSSTKAYSFFTNTASLFLNYRPLAETTYGLKLEGNFTFQDQPSDPNDTSGSYVYEKYAATGDVGLFMKTQLSPATRLEVNADFRPQTFYIDDYLSGPDFLLKMTYRHETPSPLVNPGFTLALERDSAQDPNWAFTGVTAGVFDVMRPSLTDTVTVDASYAPINYPSSSPYRRDGTLTLHAAWIRTLANHWAILGDAAYTNNSSTISDEFSYNRFVLGFGISKSI